MKFIAGLFAFFLLVLPASAEESSPVKQNAKEVQFGIALPRQITNKEDSTVLQSILNTVDYRPVPGDIYRFVLQMASFIKSNVPGNVSNTAQIDYNLVLSRDYILELPILGSLNVRGISYIELKNRVIEDIKKKLPVDYIAFTLVLPGRFEIFVGGGVNSPNVIIGTSLMRLHEAILLAGGFKQNGSYRRIRLLHADGSESIVDLSKYVIDGDDRYDPYLKPGDRIIVPMAQKQVLIFSGVKFPGLFELVGDEIFDDLIRFAGGYSQEADRTRVQVKRMKLSGEYTIFEALLGKEKLELFDGDSFTLYGASVNPSYVNIEAALYARPNDGVNPIAVPTTTLNLPFAVSIGTVASGDNSKVSAITIPTLIKVALPYYPGMNLYNLLMQFGGPTPFALPNQSIIYRKAGNTDFRFDVFRMWAHPEEAKLVEILPEDYLYIPMQDQFVIIAGAVNVPDIFPYMHKRRISDYLMMCGGMRISGDSNGIYLLNRVGQKIGKVSLDYYVQPADIVYIETNFFQALYDNIMVVLPIMTSIGSFATMVYAIITALIPKVTTGG